MDEAEKNCGLPKDPARSGILPVNLDGGESVRDIGLREVMQRILLHAVGKGFRDEEYPVDRDIAHIHREVSEAFEAYRRCPEGEDWKAIIDVGGKPEGVTVEMADALMRICEFCAYYELPLAEAIERKLAFLSTQQRLHGKRF